MIKIKKTPRLLTVMFSITLAAVSCKKESTVQQQVTVSKKLVQFNCMESPIDNMVFGYDNQSRLLSVEDGYNKFDYAYTNGKVSFTEFIKSENRIYAEGVLTQDNTGFAIKADWTQYTTPNVSSLRNDTYEYAGSYFSKRTYTTNGILGGYVTYEYTNGNVSKIKYYDSSNMLYLTWQYTYSDKTDNTGIEFQKIVITTDNLAGARNKNLVTKMEEIDGSDKKVFESQLSYEFDSDGYPVKVTAHNVNTNNDTHYSYVYNK